MREIKFRGKDLSNNWRYGDLIQKSSSSPYIKEKESICYQIIPETVGQFTGLRDKNGKKIYEGDMIYEDFYELKAEVVFIDGSFLLDYKDFFYKYGELHVRYQSLGNYERQLLEVIGNIYDNPELLKESD